MKKIQKDLQSRSFKLYNTINKSYLPKFTPAANIDLYLNFGNADFGLHGVYHVTFDSYNETIITNSFSRMFYTK